MKKRLQRIRAQNRCSLKVAVSGKNPVPVTGRLEVSAIPFSGSCRADDEHDAHAIHIHVLKERRPCASLEDVQILGIEIFRMRMSDMRSEHRRETSMMVFGQPQREDVEFMVAGEHGIEGGEISQHLLHHLSPCIDEDPMHDGDGVS